MPIKTPIIHPLQASFTHYTSSQSSFLASSSFSSAIICVPHVPGTVPLSHLLWVRKDWGKRGGRGERGGEWAYTFMKQAVAKMAAVLITSLNKDVMNGRSQLAHCLGKVQTSPHKKRNVSSFFPSLPKSFEKWQKFRSIFNLFIPAADTEPFSPIWGPHK